MSVRLKGTMAIGRFNLIPRPGLEPTVTGRIFGRRADVAHPRPGSFGSHGHRIDFCESAVLNQLCHKSILHFAEQ